MKDDLDFTENVVPDTYMREVAPWWEFNNGVLTIYGGRGTTVLPTATNQPWLAEYKQADITKIKFIGEGLEFPENCYSWFDGYTRVLEITGLEKVNTKNVKSMRRMFSGMKHLMMLDLSNFDTSNVEDINAMFYELGSLRKLDLSSFNTSNVKDMNSMFSGMSSLTELDLSNFDTSNVTDMNSMFEDNLAYQNKKVKFKDDLDFTKKEVEEEKTKPTYYKLQNIEVFDFIDEFQLNFNIGNVAKYIARYQNKNGLEDLEKAKVYLEKEINKLKKGDMK